MGEGDDVDETCVDKLHMSGLLVLGRSKRKRTQSATLLFCWNLWFMRGGLGYDRAAEDIRGDAEKTPKEVAGEGVDGVWTLALRWEKKVR